MVQLSEVGHPAGVRVRLLLVGVMPTEPDTYVGTAGARARCIDVRMLRAQEARQLVLCLAPDLGSGQLPSPPPNHRLLAPRRWPWLRWQGS